MVNTTSTPRKSIILIYEQWSEGKVASDRYASIADRMTTPEGVDCSVWIPCVLQPADDD